ncbi:MAG: helix-turn-helix transcriptional regulator [Paeniclostridium sordellii]|uniref:helix-turn-helix domain-containing protein n=1 Tax=Paraclostridium sordellii TaxID=1505 RepID=UPI0013DEB225|nr:helix-turn-helix transcriptional regulator [Paeniclostridium sordellii]MDU2686682.1 helix-turn-helix transcriptional regulator [Paeniclostridium sordellii]MDU7967083.1 helix-turn-helix transcriptional regulator [Paeniclostridium sordellii]
MENIIAKIKKRRTDLNMSYQELANKTGLSKSTLQRYETGAIKNMPIDKLEILASALNVSPAYLMGWENVDIQNELNKTENTISIKERKLLNSFNNLNETGKDEAIKRVSELTLIPSYIKEQPASDIKTIAAHNDHLTEHGEMDKIMQDIEDMDNW